MSLNRRGLGLVELVVATALTGVLAALTALILSRSAARFRERSDRVAREYALRVADHAVRTTLGSLTAGGSDLSAIGSGGFVARVMRGAGVLCEWAGSEIRVRSAAPWWTRVRDPVAGRDSLLIARLDQPEWVVSPLRSDPRSGRCPDGTPAVTLSVSLDTLPPQAIGSGSPIRFFEPVEVRIYGSSSFDWIGVRQVATGEFIQPLAGPLVRASTSFEYFNGAGGPALAAADVAAVAFRIAAASENGGIADSVKGFVALKAVR